MCSERIKVRLQENPFVQVARVFDLFMLKARYATAG